MPIHTRIVWLLLSPSPTSHSSLAKSQILFHQVCSALYSQRSQHNRVCRFSLHLAISDFQFASGYTSLFAPWRVCGLCLAYQAWLQGAMAPIKSWDWIDPYWSILLPDSYCVINLPSRWSQRPEEVSWRRKWPRMVSFLFWSSCVFYISFVKLLRLTWCIQTL